MSKAGTIDLRSDTVTRPTPAMWEAIAKAEVGDDVYGEDPSINSLEALAAELLGKEAALYVPSGTMGNLVSVLTHCGRGDEMILGDRCHIFLAEQGGSAALGGVHSHTLRNQSDGTLDLDEVAHAIRPDNEHYPITGLVAIENTANLVGGKALPVAYMDALGDLAHENGLKVHVDGARVWNAAVALGVPPARVVQNADSVSACLSKGLAAPVGSVVAGSAEFIRGARRMRKQVGGGMRQAGVIAAAGVVALGEMIDRLSEDHANAQLLAHGLAAMDTISIDPEDVHSNLVFFDVTSDDFSPAMVSAALAERNILLNATGGSRMRAVTHWQVSASDIEMTLAAFEDVLATGARANGVVAAGPYA